MALKEQVLKHLRESGGYLSGGELSGLLHVSRTAVWKSIQSLREEGYELDSVTNRGYRLLSCPDRYTAQEIRAGLETELLGKTVYSFDSVDSTNEEAKRQALRGAPNGSLFIAEQQTGGKGRLGRSFMSPAGAGIWFSVLLRPGILPLHVAATTLLSGLAVCGAIRKATGCPAMIKWPNDIVVGSKKVCGILTEMSAEMERVEYVIPGIGINVNNTAFPENLRDKATSIRLEIGKPVRRIPILQETLRRLEKLLKENAVSLTPSFLKEYKNCCVTLGRKVEFERGGRHIAAVAEDISPEGELIVCLPDGKTETVYSGEVSVQGIYGGGQKNGL